MRMTPGQRRESIVVAALEVMLEKGIAATTVRDVAARLGVSSGLIHHYVESMDALLAEAFARAAGQDLRAAADAVAGPGSAVRRLTRFFDTYARADQDRAFQVWLDAWAEASRRPALRSTSRALTEAWQRLLAELIRDGVAAGEFACADADATSWRVLSLLDGLALQTVAHGAPLSRDLVVRWSRRYAEAELGLSDGLLELAR